MIYINGRYLTQSKTGVQTYAYTFTKLLFKYYKNKLIVLVPLKLNINPIYKINFKIFRLFKIELNQKLFYFKGNILGLLQFRSRNDFFVFYNKFLPYSSNIQIEKIS